MLREPVICIREDAPKQVAVLLILVECVLIEDYLLASLVKPDIDSARMLDLIREALAGALVIVVICVPCSASFALEMVHISKHDMSFTLKINYTKRTRF